MPTTRPPTTDAVAITFEPSSSDVSAGDSFTLVANYPLGAIGDGPNVTWTKDGQPINSPRITLSADSLSFQIDPVMPSDAGVYMLTVDDGVSPALSASYDFAVGRLSCSVHVCVSMHVYIQAKSNF